ncbi:MAG: ABC transporter substrate-binding protein [Candidatus Hodarchaeota archaeon]
MKTKLRWLLVSAVVVGMVLGAVPMPVLAAGTRLDLELWYMPVERPYFPDAKSVAEIMQKDLQAIGVKIKLVTFEWGEYLDRTEDGEHDMCLLGWSADIGDPDNFIYVLLSGDSAKIGTAMNVAFYDNDDVDELLLEAQGSFVQSVRDPLYQKACWLIHKDSPWVTVAHSQNLAGVVDAVSDYVTHPTGQGANVYANVSITGDELIIARGGDSVTLDPAEWTDGQSWKVGRQIYDGLYNLPADSIDPEPGLATGYTVSSDGLEWTFKLREGVKFHDGSDFNAEAVVFSFERAANWENTSSEYYTEGWVPPEAGYYDYIYGGLDLKVEEVNTSAVKFTLAKPYAPFLASLAMGVFAIVSPTYVKAHPGTDVTDRLGLNPIGTGPYELTEWVTDSSITLEKNTDFWGTTTGENKLIFKVIPEAATRISELTAATPTVHIVDNVASADAKTVEDATGVDLISQAGMNVGYLAMNALRPPFSNDTAVTDPDFGGETSHGALVRRAFHYAIDRPTIIEEVYLGKAIQAKNPLPPSFWGYNESITDYPHDVEHAKEILESLGYDTSAVAAGFEPIVTLVTTFGAFAVLVVVYKRKKK